MNCSIADIAGLRIGHYTDTRRPTGCTVVLCEQGAICGVDVRGAAPGTRETDLLSPLATVERVHAVLLAGGSAFGLDAASGVMRWLESRGIGYEVGTARGGPYAGTPIRVPIVPAAILFDLWLGDPAIRPDAEAGYAACEAAGDAAPAQGSVGAGTGATVGKLFGIEHAMKGGIGSSALTVHGVTVGALIAVNALGDVIDRSTGRVLAGARGDDGRPFGTTRAFLQGRVPATRLLSGSATVIGVIATDATLTKAEATRLAQAGHDGLARTIDPAHTSDDGDTLFALATGNAARALDLTLLCALAAEAVACAVHNAVWHAQGVAGFPSARELGLG